MKKKHEKSPCCRRKVRRFGGRRRQCSLCKKTWRVWKAKRGRRKKRARIEFVVSFFNREISSMEYVSKKKQVSPSKVQHDMRRSRDMLLKKTAWGTTPKGTLLIIADAVVEMVEGKWRTVYLMLVRSIADTTAVILPPLIANGGENPLGWQRAFKTVDVSILRRIKAVVCDGHRGILFEARDRGWIIQRCHFHLIARIQSRRSRFAIARHKKEARTIFHHVNIVLKSTDRKSIQESLNLLEEIGWTSTSKEIRTVLKGFATNYEDFRSYITHPELNLPTTNNTAESLASMIADLKRRMRGFGTMSSFSKWIIAFLKFRQSMKCRRHQPN